MQIIPPNSYHKWLARLRQNSISHHHTYNDAGVPVQIAVSVLAAASQAAASQMQFCCLAVCGSVLTSGHIVLSVERFLLTIAVQCWLAGDDV